MLSAMLTYAPLIRELQSDVSRASTGHLSEVLLFSTVLPGRFVPTQTPTPH